MDWQKLLVYWGPLSGLAIIVFWVFVYGLDLRDDYRKLRDIVCDDSGFISSLTLSIIKQAESGNEFAQIISRAAESQISHHMRRKQGFCDQ